MQRATTTPGARARVRTRARADAAFAATLLVAALAAGGPRPAARLGLAAAPRNGPRAAARVERPAPGPTPRPAAPAAPEPARDPQRDAFAGDLVATGRVAPERARALADLAVRHARRHRLPPALVMGVLLVENEAFNSRAVSTAGARGLMQVHPLWRPLLGPRYGFDLTADSTNLAMGAHILADVLARARTAADVERGLLRYNGCRRALVARRGQDHVPAGPLRAVPGACTPPRRGAGGPLPHALVRAVRGAAAPRGERRRGRRAARRAGRRTARDVDAVGGSTTAERRAPRRGRSRAGRASS
jgi:hypothetical protein